MTEKSLKCALRKAYSGCLKISKCGQHSFFQIYYPAKIAPFSRRSQP
jgi:hypothetical protein